MKQILTIILFLTIGQNCFATDWACFYIYVQTDYVQGPWTRTDVLDKSGSYKYLQAKQYDELFGSERIDLANSIFNHLQKETESPKNYKFKYSLSLSSDTVVIQTQEIIPNLYAIKDEVIASFTLNSFIAVKIIQPGKTVVYQLKDISIPYMDLIFPGKSFLNTETDTLVKRENIKIDTLTSVPTTEKLTSKPPENKIQIWLLISIAINLVLIFLVVRRKK